MRTWVCLCLSWFWEPASGPGHTGAGSDPSPRRCHCILASHLKACKHKDLPLNVKTQPSFGTWELSFHSRAGVRVGSGVWRRGGVCRGLRDRILSHRPAAPLCPA